MDTIAPLLGIIAATMIAATFIAWRTGNEKRDVALLGVSSSFFASGSAVTAILLDLEMAFPLLYLKTDFPGKAAWIWLVFIGAVVSLLKIDLDVLPTGDSEIDLRESLRSAGYSSVSVLLGCLALAAHGRAKQHELLGGLDDRKDLVDGQRLRHCTGLQPATALLLVFIGSKIFWVGIIDKIVAVISLRLTRGGADVLGRA